MQKNVIDPSCPVDVKDVAYNNKWGKIYLIIYLLAVLTGTILLLI